jgi:hypothetical protein
MVCLSPPTSHVDPTLGHTELQDHFSSTALSSSCGLSAVGIHGGVGSRWESLSTDPKMRGL